MAADTADDAVEQSGELIVRRAGHGMKVGLCVVEGKYPIRNEHVQVYVEVQGRTKALYEGVAPLRAPLARVNPAFLTK
jgi:hypothetical protein